jgi:hypothetical protein
MGMAFPAAAAPVVPYFPPRVSNEPLAGQKARASGGVIVAALFTALLLVVTAAAAGKNGH